MNCDTIPVLMTLGLTSQENVNGFVNELNKSIIFMVRFKTNSIMAKLLIIDDEASIRRTLKEILEFENYTVDVAEDGVKGVAAAKKVTYDAIFCDIKMPQMDGLEVLDTLKADGVPTPVIMISGHGNIETAVDSIRKGAYDFIEKPLDLNRILVTIKNALDNIINIASFKNLVNLPKMEDIPILRLFS